MDTSPFIPFGAQHAAALATVVAGSVALACGVRAAGSARLDRASRWALAVGCVAFEAGDIAWMVISGGAPLHAVLPLHLCDVSILIAPIVLLTANRHAFELLYFWGFGGALQALATPALFSGFPAPVCIAFFLGHALILASALYATVVMRLRPVPWSILRVWLITNAYGLLIIPVNYALDTNYLFIRRKPLTPSLLDLLGPWPWYLASLDGIALVVLLLCYLPFFLGDRWARREPQLQGR